MTKAEAKSLSCQWKTPKTTDKPMNLLVSGGMGKKKWTKEVDAEPTVYGLIR